MTGLLGFTREDVDELASIWSSFSVREAMGRTWLVCCAMRGGEPVALLATKRRAQAEALAKQLTEARERKQRQRAA